MMATLLLDANNYGGLVGPVEGLLVAIALLWLLIWLWGKRIEQQFDREPEAPSGPEHDIEQQFDREPQVASEPEHDGAGGRLLLFVLLLALFLLAAVFIWQSIAG